MRDRRGPGHFAQAQVVSGRTLFVRDPLGVAPLYYGMSEDVLCFASEVKGLLDVTCDVHEVPPGHLFNGRSMVPYYCLQRKQTLRRSSDSIARELHRRLVRSVESCIEDDRAGVWLSGGLDSSTLAALARPRVETLYTFAAGLENAPDLDYAREVANFVDSEHREVICTVDELLSVLPAVIYHLESFDSLLVRSSLTNYVVARAASEYVSAVFSGEGGDELFAGYAYLKSLNPRLLEDELIDIVGRLHNTALQRVDRCASAHGTTACVGFLSPEVVEYALQIPVQYKLRNGVEKWILRQAMDGALPERVLERRKVKFWEGAGVSEILANHADECITDAEFREERTLPNGWVLVSKEELMYYRIFRNYFEEVKDLSWMGRTKIVPQ